MIILNSYTTMKYSDYHTQPITNTPVINYSNPLSNDYIGLHYKPIEEVYDMSFGRFYTRYDHKPTQIFATRFDGTYRPYITEKHADKAYRDKLEAILEEIRQQPTELPF